MGYAVQYGAVQFDDFPGYPQIKGTRDNLTAKRSGIVKWSDIDALLLECWPPGATAPNVYPDMPYLFVEGVDIEPFPGDEIGAPDMICSGASPNYLFAKVTIDYKTLDYDPSDLIKRKYSYGGEFMTLPSSGLRWNSQPHGATIQSEDLHAGRILPTLEHEMEFGQVYFVPWLAIRLCLGHVNSWWFEGAPPETLLFLGADINFSFNHRGNQVWKITYKFSERIVMGVTAALDGTPITPPQPSAPPATAAASITYPDTEGPTEDPGTPSRPGPPVPPNLTGTDQPTAGVNAVTTEQVTWNHFYRPDKKWWERVVDDEDNPIYPLTDYFPALFFGTPTGDVYGFLT